MMAGISKNTERYGCRFDMRKHSQFLDIHKAVEPTKIGIQGSEFPETANFLSRRIQSRAA